MNCRIALCQTNPKLGVVADNVIAHHLWLDKCIERGADVAVFPELSLTGYILRDLTTEIALTLDSPEINELVKRSTEISFSFGFVEHSRDHRFFNSTLFAEDGVIKHVHRKVHLPDYGIFEEGRYFAAGNNFTTFDSKHGRFGFLICEDAWHLSSAWLHFLQGADAILIPVASPSRGIETEEAQLVSQQSWQELCAAQAKFLQTWVVRCNRVGYEDGVLFDGESAINSPFGEVVAAAHQSNEDLIVFELNCDSLKRARVDTPLLRDAKADVVRRQLAIISNDPDLKSLLDND
ncbi:MAG: carbon-nitrogen hydrolase [Planctomycetes bacterium]|nr:carbon-nitrogen hydrolase [Planctomycetota bacterium]